MKIKRYVAKDMRTALAQIKEELGPEAVIMSNKKIPEGVELMAAVDYNGAPSAHKLTSNADKQSINAAPIKLETSLNRPLQQDQVSLASSNNISTQPKLAENNNQPASSSLSALLNRNIQQTSPYLPNQNQNQPIHIASDEEADIKQQLKSFTQRLQQSTSATVNTNSYDNLDEIHQPAIPKAITDNSTRNGKNLVNNQEIDALRDEMASIRQLLEYQVSGLMWQDLAQRDPAKAILVDRLTSLGLTAQLAEQVAGFVPKKANEDEAWQSALHLLTQQINTTNNDIIHRGGIVALVGPTGVGKTTTIAKLAARFAQIHGNDSVALISTDTFRIAGFEQLQTYGRIIGCQVKLAKDKNGLDNLIQEFANKKLILIDTAGMGQRDLRLAQHLTTLISNTRVRIRNYLVLAANTQQSVMQENVERFKKIPLVGCIYTKLDESLSFGEMISTAIQNSLPIGYLTDGQRVPEDIKVANAEKLVMLASKKINKSTFNSPHQWRPQVNVSTVTI